MFNPSQLFTVRRNEASYCFPGTGKVTLSKLKEIIILDIVSSLGVDLAEAET